MKRTLTLVGSFVLILAAVACTFGAVISAFSFDVDAGLLFIIWFFMALALSAIAALWRGKGILALILPVLAIIIWKLPEIVEGAKWIVFYISREFNKWLVVPILFPDAKESAYNITLFFAAAGIFLAFLLTIAVCLRRSAFLAVFITVPIVFVTFILIHSQPDYLFLAGLIAVYLTLLISGALHSDDFKKRGEAIFPSLALALVLMGLTYLIAPPEGYKRELRMESIDSQIRNIASRIGLAQIKYGVGWPQITPNEWRFNTDNVEISNAGTRTISDTVILEVTASESGTFYLRGFSMQRFDGERWVTNSDMLPFPEETTAMVMPYLIGREYLMLYGDEAPISIKTVNLAIDNIRDTTEFITYMPYYCSYNSPYSSRMNDDFLYIQESILKIPQEAAHYNIGRALQAYGRKSREAYTQIDEYTAAGLRRIAAEEGIDITGERGVVVDQVAQYIRTSGRYTLTPYIIPSNEDFALYFLQESKQGYCIHFATAATLMLRALDIPARFASGFTVTVPRDSVGKPFPLTDRNAHAWVEVYYDEAGWLPLEVTPDAAGSGVPGFRPHAPDSSPTPDRGDSNPDRDMDRDRDRPARETGTGAGDDQTAEESADTQGQLESIWDTILIIFVVCAGVCAATLVMRRPIAQRYRRKRFAQADTNAAVICVWRYVSRISKKKAPPEEAEELAFKARFSLHTISEEERGVMISHAEKMTSEVYRSSNAFGKIWLYIRGI